MMTMEEKLLTLIPQGRENAIHMNELCKRLHISGYKVKSVIRSLRKKGFAIVSDTDGYWIAENKKEVADFIERMSKQATSRFSSVKALKSQCKECEGQISFEVD